ncbi:unnamed protein product [Haemonchus placei]|uniref:Conserved plasma membrane protein n=1 Tax=Haemonchus placei TaxID=6290 RepID=A0A0N4XAH4_HAEPC|nr:unnamed protein product [Haemonchus placei]
MSSAFLKLKGIALFRVKDNDIHNAWLPELRSLLKIVMVTIVFFIVVKWGDGSVGYPTTGYPGYESQEQRYPEPAPFNVQPGYSGLNPSSSARPTIGAPGIRPTYRDLHPNETEYNSPPGYDQQNAYTRLIKRNIKAASLQNRSQPVPVADFDLPERGLIVFGLEDSNEEDQESENAAHIILKDRTAKTCFTTNKMLMTSTICLTLLVALIVSLSLIVYKQRRLILQTTYLKH